MKIIRLKDLDDIREGHFLKQVLPEPKLQGGIGWKKPGEITHYHDGPDADNIHVHDDIEVFVILQGRGKMLVDGKEYPLTVGDICIIHPGEDHHLVADVDDPCMNLWLHGCE